jgi:hypothetical protein
MGSGSSGVPRTTPAIPPLRLTLDGHRRATRIDPFSSSWRPPNVVTQNRLGSNVGPKRPKHRVKHGVGEGECNYRAQPLARAHETKDTSKGDESAVRRHDTLQILDPVRPDVTVAGSFEWAERTAIRNSLARVDEPFVLPRSTSMWPTGHDRCQTKRWAFVDTCSSAAAHLCVRIRSAASQKRVTQQVLGLHNHLDP